MMGTDDEELRERLRLLTTPIEFDQLVKDGVLEKAGAWWRVKDMDRLPEHARAKVAEIKSGGLVKFRK